MTCRGCGLHLAMPRILLCLGLAGLAAGPLAAQPADSHNTITGAVVDDSGAPAADIEVVLRPYPSAFEADLYVLGHSDALPEAVDRVRSDADGVFSLGAPAAGPYRLEFGRSTPANESSAAMPLVQGVIVPLKGSQVAETVDVPDRHSIAVRVLGTDDQPIAGALVVANPSDLAPPRAAAAMARMVLDRISGNYSAAAWHVFPTHHPSASRTDAEGIARIAMPTADATVHVSAIGFVLGKGTTRAGRAALSLERDPGVRLRVRGPTGAPVPGAVIRTATARDGRGNAGTSTVRRTTSNPVALGGFDTPLAITDDNGEAVIGPRPGEATALEVEAADGAFAHLSLPAANPAESPDGQHLIDVRLEEPLRIPGRIVDVTSGLPIQSAAVWVQVFPGHHAFSGPTGAFDLSIRPANRATRLQATATGFLPERVDISAADLANREEVRIGLTPSAPLRGLVTNEAGQPVAGASIRAEPRGDGVPTRFSLSSRPATSDSDGFFRVADVLYGHTYRLTAQAAGYAHTVLDLPPLEPSMPVHPAHLVLSQGRRVLGSVVDTDGHPVAEAQVSLLWPLDPSQFRSGFETPAGAAATDGRGVFALPETGPGVYEILVSHADYAHRPPSQVEVSAGESDFDLGDLTLAAGGAIHGIVRDPNGEPVGGATIQAHERDRYETPARTVTTDADGRFRLRGFSSDLADLGVQASGYPVHVEPDVRIDRDDPVLIELQPGASIDGRVLDNGGNGVGGVPVRLRIEFDLSSMSDPRLWDAVDGFPSQVTDQQGRFRFDGLAAGTWSAEASKGAEGAELDGIELIPGGEREIELLLRTRDRLIVTVVTEIGEPVADAYIRVETPGERFPTGSGRTDGSGRDVIDIDPGLATVKVSHGTLRDESRQVRFDPGDNELRFQLRPGLELSGTVRSHDGAPLALATVEADTEYSRDAESHQTNTVSDQSGAFRITGLEPRRYILTARSPGYADGGPDEPVEIGDEAIEGIEIVLEPEASIVAAVTGLSPFDLNQVEVSAWKGPRYRDATKDADGNFSIQGIGPGTWEVTAIKGEWERTVERTVTIERGMTEVFVELPFERGLRLSGQVIENGAPLGGAWLSVGDAEVRADREGRFALEGLEPGPHEVLIGRPDYTGLQYQSIDLQTDLEGVRIELEPATATVSGVVVDAETGQPIHLASLVAADAATISAITADGAGGASFVGASSSFSWPEGTFELELRTNADHLWITRDGYEDAQIPLNIAPGEHREGLVIRLQPAPPDAPDQ